MMAWRLILPLLLYVIVVLASGCGPPPTLVRYVEAQNPKVLFSVNTRDSVVALTLDDGPHPTLTPKILDTLAKYDSHATFFVIGSRLPGNHDVLRRIIEEGHELGNHMMKSYPSILLSSEEFESSLEKTGMQLAVFDTVRWFRPGSGWFNERMLRQVHAAYGYETALGSVYPNDPWNPFASYHSWYILKYTQPGSIIILHEGEAHRSQVLDVLSRILPKLKSRGYQVVTLSELVRHEATPPPP